MLSFLRFICFFFASASAFVCLVTVVKHHTQSYYHCSLVKPVCCEANVAVFFLLLSLLLLRLVARFVLRTSVFHCVIFSCFVWAPRKLLSMHLSRWNTTRKAIPPKWTAKYDTHSRPFHHCHVYYPNSFFIFKLTCLYNALVSSQMAFQRLS